VIAVSGLYAGSEMCIWPSGALFGLTKRRLRAFVFVITGILGTSLILYGAARLFLLVEARRAASFLTQLNSVRLGDERNAVLPLLRKYEDVWFERQIGADRGNYVLRVDPWHFYRPLAGPHWVDISFRGAIDKLSSLRRQLGLRAWVVNGGVRLNSESVESVWADVVVEGANEWLMADWRYGSAVPPHETELYKEGGKYRPEMDQYFVSWTHLHMGMESGEGIRNWVTPLGDSDQQRAARTINLQCLTSATGCHSLCDLMPDAAQYRHQHDYPWGWNSGSWALQDHACE